MTVVFQAANRVISVDSGPYKIKQQSCSSETQNKSHHSVPASCTYVKSTGARSFLTHVD